jgi:creatinine amidohydrolase
MTWTHGLMSERNGKPGLAQLPKVQQRAGDMTTPNRSTTSSGPILLAELSTTRLAELASDIELVLIPVGAHEQHGPALPVTTDTLTAQVLSALVGTLLRPRVAIAPVIPWGVSWTHLGMAGTISLREDTLIALVEDVVSSLRRHGFTRFLLVNTHGGNTAALQIAADRCHRDLGVPVVASIYAYELIRLAALDVLGEDAIGHGGGDESAAILAVRPELVDTDALGSRDVDVSIRRVQRTLRAAGGSLPIMQHLASPSGASGDSSRATAEAGNAILGQAAAQLRVIIEELLDLHIPGDREA